MEHCWGQEEGLYGSQVTPQEWLGFFVHWQTLYWSYKGLRLSSIWQLLWKPDGMAGMGGEGRAGGPYRTVFSIQLQGANPQHAANFLSFVWWWWHTVEHQAEHPVDPLHKKYVGRWWYMSCNKTTHKGCASLKSLSISSFFSITLKKSLSLSSWSYKTISFLCEIIKRILPNHNVVEKLNIKS